MTPSEVDNLERTFEALFRTLPVNIQSIKGTRLMASLNSTILSLSIFLLACQAGVDCPHDTEKVVEKWIPWRKKAEFCLNTSGQREGPIHIWWENGRIRISGSYVDGESHGIERSWYEEGQAQSIITIDHGKQEGLTVYWHPNGRVEIIGSWKNGQPVSSKPHSPYGDNSPPWHWCWDDSGEVVRCSWVIVEDFGDSVHRFRDITDTDTIPLMQGTDTNIEQ